jgi:hypothetical protein
MAFGADCGVSTVLEELRVASKGGFLASSNSKFEIPRMTAIMLPEAP